MDKYPDLHTVGVRLRWARKRSGLTLEEWARELEMSVEEVQEWERDETRVPTRRERKMSD